MSTQETAVEISDEVSNETLRAMEDVFRLHFPERSEIGDEDKVIVLQAIRAGLQAAIPLVVEGLVNSSYERCDPEKMGCVRDYSEGQNDLADAILAKVKK